MPRRSIRPVHHRADKYAETRAQIAKEKLALLEILHEIKELRATKGASHAFKIAAYAKEFPGRVKHVKDLVQDGARQLVILQKISKDPMQEYQDALDRAIDDLEKHDPDDLLEAYENLKEGPSLDVSLHEIPDSIGAVAAASPPAHNVKSGSSAGFTALFAVGLLYLAVRGTK